MRNNAEVPFLRPKILANDTASSASVILHLLRYLEKKKRIFNNILLLEPTSPLREPKDINKCLSILKQKKNASVVGVVRAYNTHPSFMYRRLSKGVLIPIQKKKMKSLRRQDLSKVFYPEGTIYGSSVEAFRKHKSFYHSRTYGYVVPKWKSLEIDDIYDFIMVEALMKYVGKHQ